MSELFDVLKHIDAKDYEYFSKLSEAERKSISTFMLLKWMSQSNDVKKLLMLNASANRMLFSLYKFPGMFYHVLCSCATGDEFYKWIKKTSKSDSRPVTTQILMEYYNMGKDRAREDSMSLTLEDAVRMAEELGHWDKIKKIRREF